MLIWVIKSVFAIRFFSCWLVRVATNLENLEAWKAQGTFSPSLWPPC